MAMERIKLMPIFLLICTLAGGQTKKPQTAEDYFLKGEAALERKDYMTAHAHLNECLRIDPHYAEAYRLRALTREHLGETAKALTDYNIYVDLKPENAEALLSRAILRFESDQHLLARQDFLRLLSMPAGETNTVFYRKEKHGTGPTRIFTASTTGKDQIFNYLGLIEGKLGRRDKAIAWLDSAIKTDPQNAVYRINKGTIHFDLKNYKAAEEDLKQALQIEPDNGLAIHNLATVKSALGESASAESLLSEAIEKGKNLPFPLAQRGYQRLQKNDLKGALEDYDQVVKLEPRDAENFFNRGLVKEKMKDLNGALKDFGKAIELNDQDERAWLSRGNVMSQMKKWYDAIEDYNVAITIDPFYGLAYFNRAMAYHNVKNPTAACKDLKKAEELGIRMDAEQRSKICN